MQSNRSNLSRRDFLATTAGCVAAAGIMGAGCMNENKGNGKMLAMCGLDCAACPAFIAHKTDDQALRVKTAAEWSKHVQRRPQARGHQLRGLPEDQGRRTSATAPSARSASAAWRRR